MTCLFGETNQHAPYGMIRDLFQFPFANAPSRLARMRCCNRGWNWSPPRRYHTHHRGMNDWLWSSPREALDRFCILHHGLRVSLLLLSQPQESEPKVRRAPLFVSKRRKRGICSHRTSQARSDAEQWEHQSIMPPPAAIPTLPGGCPASCFFFSRVGWNSP